MLYKSLYHALKLARDLYFTDIQAVGMENIPTSGPVIFASNHPNSIMDTVLLATQTPRKVHYMARSGLFKGPVISGLFDKMGIIPLYRAQDGGDTGQNQSSFSKAFELLERGDALGIFPEGQNSQERQVLTIKTGTARIALGAEARNEFKLGVMVVPVGINFIDRDDFLTSVLIRFGEPIDASAYAQAYAQDERQCVRDLTEAIQDGIREQATHIEDEVGRTMSESLIQIAGFELLETVTTSNQALAALLPPETERKSSGLWRFMVEQLRSDHQARQALDDRFKLQRLLAQMLEHHKQHNPSLFRQLHSEHQRYLDHMAQVSLRHDFANRHPSTMSSRKDALRLTLYSASFGPFAFWGLLHNLVPYLLTRQVALKAPDEAIRAFTGFCVGLVVFSLWYALIFYVLWHTTQGLIWVPLVYLATLPVAGYFFLRYRKVVATFRRRILVRTAFRTERNLMRALLRERERVVKLVEVALERYASQLEQPLALMLGEDQAGSGAEADSMP